MNEFKELGLKQDLVDVLDMLGFEKPLEVQTKVLPSIIKGNHVLFQSATGSGKTLAYTLGLLDKLKLKQGLQMLIVVPTRELAMQVSNEIKKICDLLLINVGVLYGGRDIKTDNRVYDKKNQIMVATPGRLVHHINDKNVKVGDVSYLIFDECDHMFDEQFFSDCNYIKTRASKDAQLVLSSATITDNVRTFLDRYDYEEIVAEEIVKNITQEKLYCTKVEKINIIEKVLKRMKFKRCIIFTNTKDKMFNIEDKLSRTKLKVRGISSDLSQKERKNVLTLFKNGHLNVLVATDIAARGLHIERVDLVVNYDLPPKKVFYVHRIGRSGRLGARGHAINLVCKEDIRKMDEIEEDYEVTVKEIGL